MHYPRKLLALLALSLLIVPLISIHAQDTSVLDAVRSHGSLNTFANILEMSGLAGEVDSSMAITVFAPNDEVLQDYPVSLSTTSRTIMMYCKMSCNIISWLPQSPAIACPVVM